MITTLLFLLICGATGWVIEVEHIEYVFSRALEIERLCNLHKHTKEWMTGVSFMTREAENDVREVAGKVFHFIIHEPMEGSRGVEKIIARTRRMNEDWFEKLYTDDAFMPQGDESKRFLSLVDSIRKFMPSLSVSGISTDILSHEKIGQYLKRSIYNDMFDWIRRTNGKYPLDKIRLNTRAQLATALLAETTFGLISSDAISMDKKRSVINGLIKVAFKNGLNEMFFANMAAGRKREETDGNYAGKQIVAFSRIVEGLVGSRKLHAELKSARRRWFQEPKDLI